MRMAAWRCGAIQVMLLHVCHDLWLEELRTILIVSESCTKLGR